MTTITLDLPNTTPLRELHDLASRLGCTLRYAGPGHYTARPRQNGGTVVHLPRRPQRVADLPTLPDAG
jgi:hypothetical protein